jgi:ketosteroid isomerase-like protein
MTNLTTVQLIYAAFQRGDIQFILDQLSDDVIWEGWPGGNAAQEAGVPWMIERHGKSGAAEFFGVVAKMDFSRFDVKAILEGDGCISSVIELDVVYKPTGKRVVGGEMHLFQFDEGGKVKGFRHYLDTARHIEAARG